MKMTLSVLLGGQGTEKYGDAPPHTLGNRTKSDASHLQQNQMRHICQSSSMTVTKKRAPPGRQQARRGKARGTTSPRGGGGAARAAMPALPVEERGKHQHRLCHFPTAVNICDHGATRETMSAGGGGVSAPQQKRTPSTRGPSTLPHQQQRRPNNRCARERRA